MNLRELAQSMMITLAAILCSMVIFSVAMFFYNGTHPDELFYLMYVGAFGSKFSVANTLTKAAPLILTALCTALPARVGLVIIGGEGALVLGALAAAVTGLALNGAPVIVVTTSMLLAGMLVGGIGIALVGGLRFVRGVNETISSLLFAYIAIGAFNWLVEGPFRDPASLNKPSTRPIADEYFINNIFSTSTSWGLPDVHWGLIFGILFCVLSYLLMYRTTFGFAANMVGGNVRAAEASGLPVGWIILITCFLGGAAAGLAGAIEIGAVHHQANATVIAGYGFTGILVSFIARHNPLAIIPVAILFGGLSAASGILQRRLNLPDASVQMLMGIMFVFILLFETLYGRFRVFLPREVREAMAK